MQCSVNKNNSIYFLIILQCVSALYKGCHEIISAKRATLCFIQKIHRVYCISNV